MRKSAGPRFESKLPTVGAEVGARSLGLGSRPAVSFLRLRTRERVQLWRCRGAPRGLLQLAGALLAAVSLTWSPCWGLWKASRERRGLAEAYDFYKRFVELLLFFILTWRQVGMS